MAVEVKIPDNFGTQGATIVLKNAAEESTMQAILKALDPKATVNKQKADTERKNEEAKKKNTQATKKATESIDDFFNELEDGNTQLSEFGKAAKDHAKGLQNATTELGANILSGGSSIDMFAGLVGQAGDTLGGAMQGLGSLIPGVGEGLGKLGGAAVTAAAGLAGFFLGQVQVLKDGFDQAAEQGATFGGQLLELKAAATASGMTLSEFTDTIRRTSPQLAAIGGTVSSGARILSDVVGRVSDREQKSLLMMGVNQQQLGEITAEFLAQQRYNGKLSSMSTQEAATGAVEFAKNLSTLSKLTGQDIDRLKAEQEQMRIQAEYASTLAKFGGNIEGFTQNAAVFRQIASQMGPQFESVFQEALATGDVVTKTNSMTVMANEEAGRLVIEAARAIRSGMDPAQFTGMAEQMLRDAAPGIIAGVQANADIGILGSVLGVSNEFANAVGQANPQLQQFFSGLQNANGSIEKFIKTAQQETDDSERPDALGDIISEVEVQMRNLRQTLEDELINGGLKVGAEGIRTAMSDIGDLVTRFKNAITELTMAVETIMSGQGRSMATDLADTVVSGYVPGFAQGESAQAAAINKILSGQQLRGEELDDFVISARRALQQAGMAQGGFQGTLLSMMESVGINQAANALEDMVGTSAGLTMQDQQVIAEQYVSALAAEKNANTQARMEQLEIGGITASERDEYNKLKAETENTNVLLGEILTALQAGNRISGAQLRNLQ